jgi:hypothetical protein
MTFGLEMARRSGWMDWQMDHGRSASGSGRGINPVAFGAVDEIYQSQRVAMQVGLVYKLLPLPFIMRRL